MNLLESKTYLDNINSWSLTFQWAILETKEIFDLILLIEELTFEKFDNEKIDLDTNLKSRIEELKNIWIKNNNLELIDEYNFDSSEIINDYKSKIIRQITFIWDNSWWWGWWNKFKLAA